MVASGQSIYLTSDKRTAISAFEMYEVHGAQEGPTFARETRSTWTTPSHTSG